MTQPATSLAPPLSAVRTAIAKPVKVPTQVWSLSALRTSGVSRVSTWREDEHLNLVHGRASPALLRANCPQCGQRFNYGGAIDVHERCK